MTVSSREITTLGTADGTPQPHRGPSSTYVQIDGYRFLVDIGSGALQKLLRAGGDPRTLDALFLTHVHMDHIGDLLPLLFGIAVGIIPRERPLMVYASGETLTVVHQMIAVFSHWMRPLPERVRFVTVSPDTRRTLPTSELAVGTVFHHQSSVAYRWTTSDGRVLAIPGDTGVHPPLASFVYNADALLIECGSDPASPLIKHLTPFQLLSFLRETRPHTAYVVHCFPSIDHAQVAAMLAEGYDGDVVFPHDLDTFFF